MPTNKKWLIIIGLIILVAGMITVGIYILKKPTPVVEQPEGGISEESTQPVSSRPEEITSGIDTAGWKTYKGRNEMKKCGFEIKYPPDWKISGMESPTDVTLIDICGAQFYKYGPKKEMLDFNDGIILGISFEEDLSKLPKSEEEAMEALTRPLSEETFIAEKFRYKNFFGAKASTKENISSSGAGREVFIRLYLKSQKGFYEINVRVADPDQRIYDKDVIPILSTFKLIEE